jgi:predicted nucleotidyltransferase/predicted HD phosphohydrolase
MGLITAHQRMADAKLRQAIAQEAARLMYERLQSEYYTAKRKAAKRLCRRGVKPEDLPSNAEIRDQIQVFARIHEGDRRTHHLREMRLEALRLMRVLAAFRPRLIGSVMTGHVRKGSDIDLHVFTDTVGLLTDLLEKEGYQFDVERKQVVKHQEARVFTHVHVYDRFNFELTVYSEEKAHYVFRSSVTGKPIERASIRELEELLAREYPGIRLEEELAGSAGTSDPYPVFRMLLLPLEEVRQNPVYHPEGDVLYHSLQVFELARDERPYDEEFLLAALLHDVGKGLDPGDHVGAALAALDGLITERTRFLIGHHMHAHDYRKGTLPSKLRSELERSPDFEDLMLLRRLDDAGRVPGVTVGTVDEALDFLRELERANG